MSYVVIGYLVVSLAVLAAKVPNEVLSAVAWPYDAVVKVIELVKKVIGLFTKSDDTPTIE